MKMIFIGGFIFTCSCENIVGLLLLLLLFHRFQCTIPKCSWFWTALCRKTECIRMPTITQSRPYFQAVFQPEIRFEIDIFQMVIERCEQIHEKLRGVINFLLYPKSNKLLRLINLISSQLTVMVGIEKM